LNRIRKNKMRIFAKDRKLSFLKVKFRGKKVLKRNPPVLLNR